MQDLTSSTSVLATWDDHEVWNNWSPEDSSDATLAIESLAAFRRTLPQRPGPNDGIWRSTKWGDSVEFFVLDCRSERLNGDYISSEQMAWLKAGLTASTARFKIILNSVPVTDLSFIPIVGSFKESDRWQGYPAQRQELIEACAAVGGVLFVSGDFHVGAATKIDASGDPGAGVTEILAGPGGTSVDSRYSLLPVSDRITNVVKQRNYARFECNPDTGTIDVEWIGNEGEVIDSRVVQL